MDPFIFGSDLSRLHKIKKYLRILEHDWNAQWNACPSPNEHISCIELVNENKLFGYTLFTVVLKVNQIGPAYVELRFEANFLGGIKGAFLQFVKPIGPMRNSIIHQVYTENTLVGYIFGKFLLLAEAKMVIIVVVSRFIFFTVIILSNSWNGTFKFGIERLSSTNPMWPSPKSLLSNTEGGLPSFIRKVANELSTGRGNPQSWLVDQLIYCT